MNTKKLAALAPAFWIAIAAFAQAIPEKTISYRPLEYHPLFEKRPKDVLTIAYRPLPGAIKEAPKPELTEAQRNMRDTQAYGSWAQGYSGPYTSDFGWGYYTPFTAGSGWGFNNGTFSAYGFSVRSSSTRLHNAWN